MNLPLLLPAQSSTSIKFILLALLSAVCMATVGVFAKYAALPAEHITFYRLFLGAICLTFYMLLTAKHLQILHKPEKITFINGVMLAGFMVFYIQALTYTSMAIAIMLIYLAPLISAVLAHFIFSERLKKSNVCAIIFALIGFVCIIQTNRIEQQSTDHILGIIYGILSAITYSAFLLLNRKPSITTPYQSTLIQLFVGALCLLPWVVINPYPVTVVQGMWLLAIGFFPGFLAILFAVKALRQLSAVTFGTLAYVEPVAVVIFAWWLFSQSLTYMQITGCLLIILAGLGQVYLQRANCHNNLD